MGPRFLFYWSGLCKPRYTMQLCQLGEPLIRHLYIGVIGRANIAGMDLSELFPPSRAKSLRRYLLYHIKNTVRKRMLLAGQLNILGPISNLCSTRDGEV